MCYNGITDKGGNTVKIGTIGYNYRHDMRTENFDLDRPSGPGAPLMLLIKTPSRFWIKGEEFTVKANSFVLFNSDTPCRYTGEGDCYTDDWIYFDMTAEDFEYLEKLGIPTGLILSFISEALTSCHSLYIYSLLSIIQRTAFTMRLNSSTLRY